MPTIDTGTATQPIRRSVPTRTRLDFWLDTALLLAFALDYSFRFTGLTIHEWIGMGFALGMLVHLTLHWDWVLRTTSRIAGRLPGKERIRWGVDLGLLGVMTLCAASGVLISRSALPFLGIEPVRGAFWTGLHTSTADITILLVSVHIALSWKWIVTVAKRMIARSPKADVTATETATATATAQ